LTLHPLAETDIDKTWGWEEVFVVFLGGDLDTSLKDGLFHEFKKFGKVTSVQIHGASEERYGLVFFRQQEDQEKALTASKGKLFFGMQIEVTAWIGPGKRRLIASTTCIPAYEEAAS